MADITVTAAKVALVYPEKAVVFDYIAAEAITRGQSLYLNSSGKAALTNGGAAATANCIGIALNKAAAGMAVSVLKEGHIAGFTLSGNYGTKAYVSATPGALADAAATSAVAVGQVVGLTDKDLTKVLYVDIEMTKIAA